MYGLCDNDCSDEWYGTICDIEKGIIIELLTRFEQTMVLFDQRADILHKVCLFSEKPIYNS